MDVENCRDCDECYKCNVTTVIFLVAVGDYNKRVLICEDCLLKGLTLLKKP